MLVCPIMLWITPSSLQQLCNCYPPFCGDKPKFVEQNGRRAHWNPLAWGVFNLPPILLTLTQFHIHTHIYTLIQSAS